MGPERRDGQVPGTADGLGPTTEPLQGERLPAPTARRQMELA